MDCTATNALIKETEDLNREAALRHAIAKAYEAGQASMGTDISPHGKLLADIRKRIERMESYIFYDNLSKFGFSYNVSVDNVVKKLKQEKGFTVGTGTERLGGKYITISYS